MDATNRSRLRGGGDEEMERQKDAEGESGE